MTDAQLYFYKCQECGQSIEYYVPIEVYWTTDEYQTWRNVNPLDKKHFKAIARYNHLMTHKGELDQWITN